MRKETLGHAARLLLIAALLVSAVLLARETGYYSLAFERLTGAAATDEHTNLLSGFPAAELAQAVRPRTVLVRTADGGCTASAYAGEETEAAFAQFSAILGEALGSAGAPEEIGEAAFRAGLGAGCVFMDFFCEQPLGVLAEWLGGGLQGAAAETRVQLLCLCLSDATAQLCYRGSDGGFYRCNTAALSETLRAKLNEFQGRAAAFAYESGASGAPAPYAVRFSALPDIACISGGAVRDGVDAAELMQTAGMNHFVASSYVEPDGTRVFIDNEKTLRLGPDGSVSFRTDAAEGERQCAEGLPAAASYAFAAAARSIGRYAGDAELYLSGITADGTDAYTVTFDYCVDGIPLRLAEGNAARFVLQNGRLAEFRLTLRSYTHTGETERLLPMRLAAAIADAAGAVPALIYADSGEQVSCLWVKD